MSDATATRAARVAGGTLSTRIAAIAVVLALAGLAAYTLFSGPTTVPLPRPVKVAPSRTAPPVPEGERQGEGGDRGD